ncbi:MAG: PorP/SprF family type IX secretion system membrane protein [Verrucomicrobia bacterium]|nr:PorP/SprF family type IX secretion system membrane protein [Cytophagales bacterium]
MLSSQSLFAQDPQFSQPYASALYLNPAFTGTTAQGRAIVGYRNQWTRLPGTFSTTSFSVDYNVPKLRSGFGILATTDKVGIASLQASMFSALYAFDIPFSNDWHLRTGFQFMYANRSLNFFDLTFNDQIQNGTFTGSPSSEPTFPGASISYFDFSAGFLLHNENVWLGVSAHHLNRPNQSLTLTESRLPTKFSVQTGLRFPVVEATRTQEGKAIITSLLYRQQGLFKQLDLGVSYVTPAVWLGLGYRGFPFQTLAQGYFNQDALVFSAGLKYDNFRFLYSYDATVSSLAGTGGSHEVSLTFRFGENEKYSGRKKFIEFPAFF